MSIMKKVIATKIDVYKLETDQKVSKVNQLLNEFDMELMTIPYSPDDIYDALQSYPQKDCNTPGVIRKEYLLSGDPNSWVGDFGTIKEMMRHTSIKDLAGKYDWGRAMAFSHEGNHGNTELVPHPDGHPDSMPIKYLDFVYAYQEGGGIFSNTIYHPKSEQERMDAALNQKKLEYGLADSILTITQTSQCIEFKIYGTKKLIVFNRKTELKNTVLMFKFANFYPKDQFGNLGTKYKHDVKITDCDETTRRSIVVGMRF